MNYVLDFRRYFLLINGCEVFQSKLFKLAHIVSKKIPIFNINSFLQRLGNLVFLSEIFAKGRGGGIPLSVMKMLVK